MEAGDDSEMKASYWQGNNEPSPQGRQVVQHPEVQPPYVVPVEERPKRLFVAST